MYSAARNCTERRVDDATHEILFVLETCSELMLPLASLTQCPAMSAPEYPSANPNLRNLQPWLYFQQHGSPDSSFSPPGDPNCGHCHDAVASCSLFDHPGIPNCVQAARAISASLETISLSGSRSLGPESRLFPWPFALPVAGRRRSEIPHLTDSSLPKEL